MLLCEPALECGRSLERQDGLAGLWIHAPEYGSRAGLAETDAAAQEDRIVFRLA
jgi:hypothetical protein